MTASCARVGWLGRLPAMALALFFLLRLFLKHLKRVNLEEEPDPTEVRFQGPPEPDADHETKP